MRRISILAGLLFPLFSSSYAGGESVVIEIGPVPCIEISGEIKREIILNEKKGRRVVDRYVERDITIMDTLVPEEIYTTNGCIVVLYLSDTPAQQTQVDP